MIHEEKPLRVWQGRKGTREKNVQRQRNPKPRSLEKETVSILGGYKKGSFFGKNSVSTGETSETLQKPE